jgi:hypothetical protein
MFSHVQPIDIERDMKRGRQLTASVSIESHRGSCSRHPQRQGRSSRLSEHMPAALPGTGHARDFPRVSSWRSRLRPKKKHGRMPVILVSANLGIRKPRRAAANTSGLSLELFHVAVSPNPVSKP